MWHKRVNMLTLTSANMTQNSTSVVTFLLSKENPAVLNFHWNSWITIWRFHENSRLAHDSIFIVILRLFTCYCMPSHVASLSSVKGQELHVFLTEKTWRKSVSTQSPNVQVQTSITVSLVLVFFFLWLDLAQLRAPPANQMILALFKHPAPNAKCF